MFPIDKNIPFPTPKRALKKIKPTRGKNQRLKLVDLEIGDSMYVPSTYMSRRNVQIMGSKLAADLNRLFRTKKEGEGCRIWRIK